LPSRRSSSFFAQRRSRGCTSLSSSRSESLSLSLPLLRLSSSSSAARAALPSVQSVGEAARADSIASSSLMRGDTQAASCDDEMPSRWLDSWESSSCDSFSSSSLAQESSLSSFLTALDVSS
jgi:hypothetical protein